MSTLTSVEKSQLTQFRKRLLKEIEAVRKENQVAIMVVRSTAGLLQRKINRLDRTEALSALSEAERHANAAVLRMEQAEQNMQPMCDKIYAHFDSRMHGELRTVIEAGAKEPWFQIAINNAIRERVPSWVGEDERPPGTWRVVAEPSRPWWKFW